MVPAAARVTAASPPVGRAEVDAAAGVDHQLLLVPQSIEAAIRPALVWRPSFLVPASWALQEQTLMGNCGRGAGGPAFPFPRAVCAVPRVHSYSRSALPAGATAGRDEAGETTDLRSFLDGKGLTDSEGSPTKQSANRVRWKHRKQQTTDEPTTDYSRVPCTVRNARVFDCAWRDLLHTCTVG
jgi:hypothetical protein